MNGHSPSDHYINQIGPSSSLSVLTEVSSSIWRLSATSVLGVPSLAPWGVRNIRQFGCLFVCFREGKCPKRVRSFFEKGWTQRHCYVNGRVIYWCLFFFVRSLQSSCFIHLYLRKHTTLFWCQCWWESWQVFFALGGHSVMFAAVRDHGESGTVVVLSVGKSGDCILFRGRWICSPRNSSCTHDTGGCVAKYNW